jgi:putative MATE family efflux protein
MAKQSRAEMLGNYDVKKLLIKLAVPATIGMAVNALYNLVDTLFVGIGAGEDAIGALGLAFPVQMILLAVGLMIGIGSASVFSRAYGRQDHEQMRHVANTALRLDLIFVVFIVIFGFVFLDEILTFFGATDINKPMAKEYLNVILIGLLPFSFTLILNNLTRAEGRMKIAMIAMMTGAGLNIILDPLFIFVFNMGVEGAAIATVISQFVAFIYIFSQAQSKDSELHINIKELFDFDVKTVTEILKIGFPTFIRNGIAAFLAIFIFRMISLYGGDSATTYQSIYSVINRVIMFLFLPAFGLIQGLNPIAGFNYGAKNYDRLHTVIIFTVKLVTVYFLTALAIVMIFSPAIFSIFSKDNNTEFINQGSLIFRTISIGFILVGFQVILGAIYQAFGYPIRALLVAASRQFIFFVPIAIVLLNLYELDGLWYTFASADLISGLLCLIGLIVELRIINRKHHEQIKLKTV